MQSAWRTTLAPFPAAPSASSRSGGGSLDIAGTGVFGSVNATGLAPGQSIEVDYGTLTPGELAITIVPETSSALLSLLGAGFLLRRRRSGLAAP